jgi:mRNA-degrading endonuclease RelE of RelBE toxin-antitoxin system
MAYRILVAPAAARRLQTFLPYVVQGLGRQLAELLEASAGGELGLAGAGGSARTLTLELDSVSVLYRIDDRDETLTVLDVQERPGAYASAADGGAAATTI